MPSQGQLRNAASQISGRAGCPAGRHLLSWCMAGELLLCIFSYNRGPLLENLLQSIQQFYPELPKVIFDDDSTDKKTQQLLANYREQGIPVQDSRSEITECKHGGLYRNMQKAVDYARENGFRYAYFVQDDMQFIWRDEQLLERLDTLFSRAECLMCNFNFLQKILRKGLSERLVKMKDGQFYSFYRRGVADTGIIDLEKAGRYGIHFKYDSERENGEHWYEQGFRLYWLPNPHLAFLPYPTSFRFRRGVQRRVYTLKPLSDLKKSEIVRNRDFVFLEDYTSTKRFLPKPYWYTVIPGWWPLTKIYLKYYLGR